jgi:hypothetical protein
LNFDGFEEELKLNGEFENGIHEKVVVMFGGDI